ncbi:MAG TPA: methyl-accepting chemotaxis protein [Anaerolineae bacterium]|nr:methyl-accepting chemotaxis protein [Anaerolineae bacterium]
MVNPSPRIQDRLRQLLSPPLFPDDLEKTRIASLLNTILLVILILVALFGIAVLVTGGGANAAIEGIILALVVALLFALRRGHVHAAALVLSIALWGIVTLGTWMGGGLRGSGTSSLLGVILIAGLLLGGRAGILFGALSIVATGAMLVAEGQGTLPPVPPHYTSTYAWIELTTVVAGVTGLLYLATGSLKRAVDRAQRNEQELSDSNRALNETRISLERHNRELTSAVATYVAYMDRVTGGDLSARLDQAGVAATDGALVLLGRRLDETAASLRQMIGEIRTASDDLSHAAVEILAATTQQARSAGEQSAAVAQTTASVDEVRSIAQQSALRAQEVSDMACQTVEVSLSGQDVVENSVHGISRIKEQMAGISDTIVALSRQMKQIGAIVTTVNDLASQSNMLALNAAIEAARAGEQGKGFGVVAAEVRSLATQSRQATGQIRAILQELEKAAGAAAIAAEEGIRRVDEGVALVAETGQVIGRLASVIDESAHAAGQMLAGGRQQAAGMEQIALVMQSINQATAHSLASTRQAEASARDLTALSARLTEMVARYHL